MGVDTDDHVDRSGSHTSGKSVSSSPSSKSDGSSPANQSHQSSADRSIERASSADRRPVVLDFSIDDDILANGCPFRERSDRHLEFQRIVPIEGAKLPLLWVDDPNEDFNTLLEETRSIRSHAPLASASGRTLFEVEWSREFLDWLSSLYSSGMYLLSVESESGSHRWSCIALLRSERLLPDFYENITSKNLDITINELAQIRS